MMVYQNRQMLFHDLRPKAIKKKTFQNKKFTFWTCKKDQKLMFCDEFLNKDVSDCKRFVTDQKLCFNCLSKNHHVKDCISEFTCCPESCGKRHHTLLREDKTRCQIQIL